MSNKGISIGHRFMQIVLRNQYAFQLNENTLKEIFIHQKLSLFIVQKKLENQKI